MQAISATTTVFRLWLVGFLLPVNAWGAGPAAPLRATFQDDAALHDVCFVDALQGWAVGDHGTVWHSADGGSSWQRQHVPLQGALYGVSFVDSRNGWIVGSWQQPYTHSSRGFVLKTSDGGVTWSVATKIDLPGLRQVTFFNRRQGIAIGSVSYAFPTGIYTTNDGGLSWNAVAGEGGRAWVAGAFRSTASGLLLDAEGNFGHLHAGKLKRVSQSTLPSVCRGLLLTPDGSGWIVGDDATLVFARAEESGAGATPPLTWQANSKIRDDLMGYADFRAIARAEQHLWIVGEPGGRVLHSADGGVHWDQQHLDVSVPLHAITFADTQHGWAVGEFGTIVATHDGGVTWEKVRDGGNRAAVYACFPTQHDVPWPLLAKLAAEDGYMVAVEVARVTPTNLAELPIDRDPQWAIMQAVTAVGAHATLPNRVIRAWDRARSAQGPSRQREALTRYFARQLRIWRPDLVIAPPRTPLGKVNDSNLPITQSIVSAIELAADPLEMPALNSHVGLPPWQVKKLYAQGSPHSPRGEILDVDQLSPRLSCSLHHWTTLPRALAEPRYQRPQDPLVIELLANFPGAGEVGAKLLEGEAVLQAEGARRAARPPSIEALGRLGHVTDLGEKLQQLAQVETPDAQWASRVIDLTGGLELDVGAGVLLELADTYHRAGRRQLAADTLYLLVKRYPDHLLLDYVFRTLVQFYCSQEIERQLAGPVPVDDFTPWQQKRVELARAQQQASDARPDDEGQIVDEGLREVSHETPTAAEEAARLRDPRMQRAFLLIDFLEKNYPLRITHPEVALPISSLKRRTDIDEKGPISWSALKRIVVPEPWKQTVRNLRSLDTDEEVSSRCRFVEESPLLDGLFSEVCWRQNTFHIERQDVDLRAISDGRFLFLAVRCPKSPQCDYSAALGDRSRDADLTHRDHVQIEIDVDCDAVTAFELGVDYRGWTHDAVAGDPTWNPSWYVAAGDAGEHWKAEVAIPLGELMGSSPDEQTVWQIRCRRQLPRQAKIESEKMRSNPQGASTRMPGVSPAMPGGTTVEEAAAYHLLRFGP